MALKRFICNTSLSVDEVRGKLNESIIQSRGLLSSWKRLFKPNERYVGKVGDSSFNLQMEFVDKTGIVGNFTEENDGATRIEFSVDAVNNARIFRGVVLGIGLPTVFVAFLLSFLTGSGWAFLIGLILIWLVIWLGLASTFWLFWVTTCFFFPPFILLIPFPISEQSLIKTEKSYLIKLLSATEITD